MFSKKYYFKNWLLKTTAHPWCGGHCTSINACKVWGARVEVQVSRREFHTHIYLDWDRVEILSCIQKKKKRICFLRLRSYAIAPCNYPISFTIFFLYILLLFNFNFLLLFNIFFYLMVEIESCFFLTFNLNHLLLLHPISIWLLKTISL